MPEEDALCAWKSAEDYRRCGKTSEVGFRAACCRPMSAILINSARFASKATPTAAAHTLPQPWPWPMFMGIIRSLAASVRSYATVGSYESRYQV